MNAYFIKISALLCALLALGLTSTGWATTRTRMSGTAEVGYVKYDAEVDGQGVVSGNSLAQKYSLDYKATNLVYKLQPRYYDLNLGYDWMNFDTTVSDQQQKTTIKQSFGKVKYSAAVGFNGDELPIKVSAYLNNIVQTNFKNDVGRYFFINDGLTSHIEGRGKSLSSGITFSFLPDLSRNAAIRALPQLLLDYRQVYTKGTEGFSHVEYRLRDLSVAGLNQQNNWINYRSTIYENLLDASDSFALQRFQIGLIDHRGERKWAALTNWIEVSADGQLTSKKSLSSDLAFEEYDVNFMALATRKLWSASSFMNYNRSFSASMITETARVPIYVTGLYGSDTDWYASLAASRARTSFQNNFSTTATNSITAGGTTFHRSSFTLAPSISIQTTKSSSGVDSYSFSTDLETASTRRFSDKLGLRGRLAFRATDNGSASADSRSWSTIMNLTSVYTANSRLSYTLEESLELGSGSGYLAGTRLLSGAATVNRVGSYLRNYLSVTSRWVPTSQLSSMLSGSYEYLKATELRPSSNTYISYNLGYSSQDTYYRFDSQYMLSQNGYDPARYRWVSSAEIQYRPDRYNDGLFRLSHAKELDVNSARARFSILQRYSYNLYTLSGAIRNLATFTEEYGCSNEENLGNKTSSQHLMFIWRYNPLERLSLNGSVRYESTTPGAVVMFYGAGMSADFKLLATSLDYAYAKRDADNRIEKKISANVRRQF